MKRFCTTIDRLNIGARYSSLLVIPLVLLITMEVILRYIFNRPTIWVSDIIIQLAAVLAVMGSGYTLLQGGHVKIDVIVLRLPSKAQAIMELVTGFIFLFTISMLTWLALSGALESVSSREVYSSYLRPPLYPLKVIVLIGIVLLLLQGVVKLIRDFLAVLRPREENKP